MWPGQKERQNKFGLKKGVDVIEKQARRRTTERERESGRDKERGGAEREREREEERRGWKRRERRLKRTKMPKM